MAKIRETFFSFHYRRDIWRASVVRNSGVVNAKAAAGWNDASLWEAIKLKGDGAVKAAIDRGLQGTEMTVVLIGRETAKRKWVDYEIQKSIERGNGLLGIRIHNIRNQSGKQEWFRGSTPQRLLDQHVPVTTWSSERFGAHLERAAATAGKRCLPHNRDACFRCRYIDWWL